MRDRDDFIGYAAVMLMHPSGDEAAQKRNARAAKASAEALADELGLGAPPEPSTPPWARERIHELEARVAELEGQLEQATAPKGKAR